MALGCRPELRISPQGQEREAMPFCAWGESFRKTASGRIHSGQACHHLTVGGVIPKFFLKYLRPSSVEHELAHQPILLLHLGAATGSR